MHPKQGSHVLICLLLLACPVLASAATGTLSGIVQDAGEESANNGIPAVRIKVQDASGKLIANGLTDANGRYEITLTAPGTAMMAFYERVGFQPRPKSRTVMDVTKEQLPVLMVREGAANAYYQALAMNIKARRAGSREENQEHAYAVAALPTADKHRVMGELKKFGGNDILSDIQFAEAAQRLTSNVQAKLVADQAFGSRSILVQSDPILDGHVRLVGAVSDVGEKTKAEKITKSVEGVKQITNSITIMK